MKFITKEIEEKLLYKLLTGLIIPRPIGWISTIDENGINNLAPFSYFNMVSSDAMCYVFYSKRQLQKQRHTKQCFT